MIVKLWISLFLGLFLFTSVNVATGASEIDKIKSQFATAVSNDQKTPALPQCRVGFFVDADTGEIKRLSNYALSNGLMLGDIIVKINGTNTSPPSELLRMIRAVKPSEIINVSVIRNGKEFTFSIPCQNHTDFQSKVMRMNQAGADGDWDSCIKQANTLDVEMGLSALVSVAKLRCTIAEYIEARKRYDTHLAALSYETNRRIIQEVAWGTKDFDSIKVIILQSISEMEKNRFFNFAKELQATWDQYTTPKKHKPVATTPKPAKKGQGTCFAVSPEGHIMTANHVVDGANSYTIRFVGDSTKYDAKLINSAKASDLALLQIDQPTPNWLSFKSMKKVNVGTPIFTMGFPAASLQGTEPKFTDGTVSSKSGIKGDSTFFQMSVPIQPGNSGGPVLTNDGEVVGIVTSTAAVEFYYKNIGTMPQNVNWAVKSDYAMLLVDQPDKKTKVANREKAISIANKSICFIEVTTK